MSETQQRTIFGEEINELVNVETTGRIIRPFKRMVGQVAKEYRLQFTDDGIEYSAHGSARYDRGDDVNLLLEMADTRAAKRATARATGVGMVAVSELQNEL